MSRVFEKFDDRIINEIGPPPKLFGCQIGFVDSVYEHIVDALGSHHFLHHAEIIGKKYPGIGILVYSIGYFPNGKVGPIGIMAVHPSKKGEQGFTYTIMPNSVDVLAIFKLQGMNLAGRTSNAKVSPLYSVLTITESRIPWAAPEYAGLVGGCRDEDEDVSTTAHREVKEETGWVIPGKTEFFEVRTYPVQGGSTQETTLVGLYMELDGRNPPDVASVRQLRTYRGGLAEETERIRSKLSSFKEFLGTPSLEQRFAPDLYYFTHRLAIKGNIGPKRAYERAEKTVRRAQGGHIL